MFEGWWPDPKRDDHIDAAHDLFELGGLAVGLPPELGEVVGADDDVLGDDLMTCVAVRGHDAFVTIAEVVECLGTHAIAIELVHEEHVVSVVVVAPEAGLLVGDLVVTAAKIATEEMGEAGLASARGAHQKDDGGLEVARLGDNALVLLEGLAEADPLGEVVLSDALVGVPGADVALDLEQVCASSLVVWFSECPRSFEVGGCTKLLCADVALTVLDWFNAVVNGLFLCAAPFFKVRALHALEEMHGVISLGLGELHVSLKVLVVSTLALVNTKLDVLPRGVRHVKQTQSLGVVGIDGKTHITVLG